MYFLSLISYFSFLWFYFNKVLKIKIEIKAVRKNKALNTREKIKIINLI